MAELLPAFGRSRSRWAFGVGDRAAMKACPACAEEVNDAANVCHHCGYRFDRKPLSEYAKWVVALGVAILVLSFFVVLQNQ